MARRAKIEVRGDTLTNCYIRITAANGETVLVSETYDTWSNAKAAANRVKRIVAGAEVVDMTNKALHAD